MPLEVCLASAACSVVHLHYFSSIVAGLVDKEELCNSDIFHNQVEHEVAFYLMCLNATSCGV